MLPARIACGLALRRARRLPLKTGWWATVMRWTARLAIPPLVGIYLLFVYIVSIPFLGWFTNLDPAACGLGTRAICGWQLNDIPSWLRLPDCD